MYLPGIRTHGRARLILAVVVLAAVALAVLGQLALGRSGAVPMSDPESAQVPWSGPSSTPAATPQARQAPEPTPASGTCGALQTRIDGASAGSTVDYRGCTNRGEVTIAKALTILGGTNVGRVFVSASDVTIDGMEVTGGNAPAQHGAVHVRDADRFTLMNATIHRNGGAGISIAGGSDHRIHDSELAYNGQQGFHLPGVSDTEVRGNRIHHNNTDEHDPGWEAGGGKATRTLRVTFEANEVYANHGPGLWCDIFCRETVYRANRVYDNTYAGIFEEVSFDGLIEDNILYGNGTDDPRGWGWPASILVSSSTGTVVRDNVVAHGDVGISIIAQRRDMPGDPAYTDITVTGNSVIGSATALVAWLDPDGMRLFDAASRNRGSSNRYWHSAVEGSDCRFEWDGCRDSLASFEITPGENAARYLSDQEKDEILSESVIPDR